MDRRAFLQASAFAFTPRIARAQPTAKVRRIGILTAGTVSTSEPSAFYAALRELGWVEGENLIIERRGAAGKSEAVPALAAELVRLNPDVITAGGAVAGVAAKNATTTIPIVAVNGDPVRLGLVSSMSHPGGNITGISVIAPELAAKRLEILRELIPPATRVGETSIGRTSTGTGSGTSTSVRFDRSDCRRSLSKSRSPTRFHARSQR